MHDDLRQKINQLRKAFDQSVPKYQAPEVEKHILTIKETDHNPAENFNRKHNFELKIRKSKSELGINTGGLKLSTDSRTM